MIYLDTSALLKLVWVEEGSDQVAHLVEQDQAWVSSTLLAVEARRGVIRNDPSAMPRVDVMLARFQLVGISDAVIESASRLPDPMLRSLDAIHLATALLVRDDIDVLVSYDDRLTMAAAAHGLHTATPT